MSVRADEFQFHAEAVSSVLSGNSEIVIFSENNSSFLTFDKIQLSLKNKIEISPAGFEHLTGAVQSDFENIPLQIFQLKNPLFSGTAFDRKISSPENMVSKIVFLSSVAMKIVGTEVHLSRGIGGLRNLNQCLSVLRAKRLNHVLHFSETSIPGFLSINSSREGIPSGYDSREVHRKKGNELFRTLTSGEFIYRALPDFGPRNIMLLFSPVGPLQERIGFEFALLKNGIFVNEASKIDGFVADNNYRVSYPLEIHRVEALSASGCHLKRHNQELGGQIGLFSDRIMSISPDSPKEFIV
ncbi:MAG: hypothetical protein K8R21_08060 [Leptospira sp.]|nr:hypothetical protein [Leptospira sp.]